MLRILTILLCLWTGAAEAQSGRRLLGGGHKVTLQPVTARFFVPQSTQAIVAGKEQIFTRYEAFTAGVPVTSIRVAYCNFGPNSETSPGGTLTIAGAGLEMDDLVVKSAPFTWGGQSSVTIVGGSQSALSDPILPSAFGLSQFPANFRLWFRTDATESGASGWLYGDIINTAWADQGIQATTPFALQSSNTGQVSGLTGQGNLTGGTHPCVVLGTTASPINSAVILGDSIGVGINDTGGTRPPYGRGMGRLNSSSTYPGQSIIPYINLGASGESATGATFVNRGVWFKYPNTAVIEYGINDMKTGGATAAQTQTANLSIASQLKAAGVKYVYLTTITPYTSSTDSWATTVNQTDLGNGAAMQTYNTNILGLSNPNVNGIWNQGNLLRDGGVTLDWAVPNFTGDGLHPLVLGFQTSTPSLRTLLNSNGIAAPVPDQSWVRPSASYDLDFKNDRYFNTFRTDNQLFRVNRTTVGYGSDVNNTTLYAYGVGVADAGILRIVPGVGAFVNAAITNLFSNPFAPATQTATVVNGTTYTVSIVGPGSLVLSSACTGTVTAASPVTCVASGTSLIATVSGSPASMQAAALTYAVPPVTGLSTRDDIETQTTLASLISGAAGAVVVQTRKVNRSNGAPFGLGGGFSVRATTSTTFTVSNGVNNLVGTIGGAGTFASPTSIGLTWDGVGRSTCANGGAVATDANGMGTHNNIFFGGLGQAGTQIDDVIERIIVYPAARLSDATLQQECVVH
jgi:hypothetical protein